MPRRRARALQAAPLTTQATPPSQSPQTTVDPPPAFAQGELPLMPEALVPPSGFDIESPQSPHASTEIAASPLQMESYSPPAPAMPSFDNRVSQARSKLESAVRDELGFAAESLALTGEQVRWVTTRMDAETDGDADEAAGVDPIKRSLWLRNPEFRALYDTCQDNRREAMRLLGTQMLPLALRTIYSLLTGDSVRGKQVGLTMLLRSQGLLIDKQVRTDPDQLANLLGMLRESRPPTIVDARSVPILSDTRAHSGVTGEYMTGDGDMTDRAALAVPIGEDE